MDFFGCKQEKQGLDEVLVHGRNFEAKLGELFRSPSRLMNQIIQLFLAHESEAHYCHYRRCQG